MYDIFESQSSFLTEELADPLMKLERSVKKTLNYFRKLYERAFGKTLFERAKIAIKKMWRAAKKLVYNTLEDVKEGNIYTIFKLIAAALAVGIVGYGILVKNGFKRIAGYASYALISVIHFVDKRFDIIPSEMGAVQQATQYIDMALAAILTVVDNRILNLFGIAYGATIKPVVNSYMVVKASGMDMDKFVNTLWDVTKRGPEEAEKTMNDAGVGFSESSLFSKQNMIFGITAGLFGFAIVKFIKAVNNDIKSGKFS